MVGVADLSQDLVNLVLDDFVATIKTQTNLGLGTPGYVENVFKRALGDEKAATVLGKIMPPASSKGLEILHWMDAKSIGEMINKEHPQVIAIILSVLEHDVAAQVLGYVPEGKRAEIIQRVASLDTVQPSAMAELEGIMAEVAVNVIVNINVNVGFGNLAAVAVAPSPLGEDEELAGMRDGKERRRDENSCRDAPAWKGSSRVVGRPRPRLEENYRGVGGACVEEEEEREEREHV